MSYAFRRAPYAVIPYAILIAVGMSSVAHAGEVRTDSGWTLTRMDVDVVLHPEQETLRASGVMTLRCEAESSMGPRLVLNSRHTVLEFVSVEGTDVASVELNVAGSEHPEARYAQIELREPARRGDEVQLRFECRGAGKGYQIRIDPDVATASWTDAWYPFPDDDSGRSASQRMSATGTTVIRMPTGWKSLSEGRLVGRTTEGDEAIETWRLDVPMARSFVAGPYNVARHRVGDRDVSVYLLTAGEANAGRQAEVLGLAIEAMEKRFGAFPFPSYGIAEVPGKRFDWSAASQQGLIFADSPSFRGSDGNLPLFAHEAAHAWWGNLVGSRGPGGILCTESLAQYGAVVALEGVRGVDAATEFLRFSAPGYSPQQCAKGYFEMIARGEDRPLSQLGSGGWQHHLSDAKGHWVYHMLRQRVGDDLFFATLRSLIDTYRGRHMSLDDLRAAFVRAAGPEAELETFFEQWLDRTGAPELELQWAYSRTDRGGLVEGAIRQVQTGEPYHLFVTLALAGSGSSVGGEHVVELRSQTTEFSLEVDAEIDEVILDPHHHILMWRPEYGSSPLIPFFWAAAAVLLVAMLVWVRRRKARGKSGPLGLDAEA
jgi:aminopeptidase N